MGAGVDSPTAVAAGAGVVLPTAVADAGVLLPTVVGTLPPPVGVGDLTSATGMRDLLPTAGAGDLLPALGAGVFSIVAGAGPFSTATDAEDSTPARCWTRGGPPATSVSRSSDFEKSTLADDELYCSRVDSGVVCGERPSISRLLFSLSWSSFLFLFLSRVAFSSSFLLLSASTRRRFAVRISRSGGSKIYPLWVSPCEHD